MQNGKTICFFKKINKKGKQKDRRDKKKCFSGLQRPRLVSVDGCKMKVLRTFFFVSEMNYVNENFQLKVFDISFTLSHTRT